MSLFPKVWWRCLMIYISGVFLAKINEQNPDSLFCDLALPFIGGIIVVLVSCMITRLIRKEGGKA